MSADKTFRSVEFDSQGITLRGRLYEAIGEIPRPAVVMSHGFSATVKGMVADRYAEVLHTAGFTVLLFDHAYFGNSDGLPRNRISAWRQARGMVDALDFLRGAAGVAPERIALWGDSFSAGVAMLVAAVSKDIAALILQVPSCGRDFPQPAADEDAADRMYGMQVREALAADLSTASFAEQPERPIVSPDQINSPSWLEPITAFRWFMEYGGQFGTGWVNRGTRAEPVAAPMYIPVRCASLLPMPALFIVARNDEMPGSREDVARFAFARVPGAKELLEIDGGHFGLLYHPGPVFDQVSSAQVAFLSKHLGDHEERP